MTTRVAGYGPGFGASWSGAEGEGHSGRRSRAVAAPKPADSTGDHCRTACEVVSPAILSCQARIQYARRNGEAATARSGFTRQGALAGTPGAPERSGPRAPCARGAAHRAVGASAPTPA